MCSCRKGVPFRTAGGAGRTFPERVGCVEGGGIEAQYRAIGGWWGIPFCVNVVCGFSAGRTATWPRKRGLIHQPPTVLSRVGGKIILHKFRG